ncbi:uncharacterized protein BO66DRAFT_240280 [Aspergillus aculeatinus CBS 121060]|uniref:Uncharacterized protein n=1 Tax=Aspergillus aculeatinus CBS 121060 TaxID=1448322 RepID=A0ACD1GSU3_9EURO|nr:hypothetical protein BO66DRAFT_240280 [Aspergillus aculeatinus CBS 121060]RAH64416.1 hypothetical protein BO66DRAFT_240280 [Aspergillus aculeatinus CBS 121060]
MRMLLCAILICICTIILTRCGALRLTKPPFFFYVRSPIFAVQLIYVDQGGFSLLWVTADATLACNRQLAYCNQPRNHLLVDSEAGPIEGRYIKSIHSSSPAKTFIHHFSAPSTCDNSIL